MGVAKIVKCLSNRGVTQVYYSLNLYSRFWFCSKTSRWLRVTCGEFLYVRYVEVEVEF